MPKPPGFPGKNCSFFLLQARRFSVAADLDLVDVAVAFHQDDSGQVEQWLNQHQLEAVDTDQAKRWVAEDSLVWAVVVKPWVLIQSDNKL